MTKKQSNKKRNYKCSQCGRLFTGSRYLTQHINTQHNNNNNNNSVLEEGGKKICRKCGKVVSKKHMAEHKTKCGAMMKKEEKRKEKKSFNFFLNFLIKLISIYNEKVEIANLIGDEFDQRKYLYKYKNKELIKEEDDENSSLILPPPKSEENSPMPSESENEEDNKGSQNKECNNNEEKISTIAKYFKKLRKKEINLNNKALRKYFEIKSTKIDHNKIKIITNNKKIEEIRKLNYYNNNNDLKMNDGNTDLFLECINQYAFTKISCRQVIRYATTDKEIIRNADKIINKKIKDYPTDQEIKSKDEEISNKLANIRNNNMFYNEKIEFFTLLVKNFLNKEQIFLKKIQCDYCFHFVLNKKRHLLQCKKFKNTFEKNKGALLMKYLLLCYPLIKPEVKLRVTRYLEKKSLKYIYKKTRGILKFGLLKALEKEEEKKEKKKETKKIKKKDWLDNFYKELKEEEKREKIKRHIKFI